MFIKQRTISLTLLASLFALASVEAHDFQPLQRDHKRLIKKRTPLDLLGGLANVVPDPSASANPGSSLPVSLSSVLPSGSSVSVLPSGSGLSNSVSPSGSASSLPVSSLSPSSSIPVATSKTTPPPDPTKEPAENSVPVSRSTVTKTASSLVAAVATSPPTQQQEAAIQKKSTITTILIVIAASVGGVAILWTIFRKWKLGASKKFDARMDPINWQPTNDDDIVPAHRLARTNSQASSNQPSAYGHGAGGYRDPALDHDFTSVPPSHLAPVGGYADLTRGPSPQPQMQENLNRGPSINRSYGAAYDTGVPLHHQAGYGRAEAYDYNGDAVRF
ncbi:hypothetical protein MIND_00468900 [Mycena indigotica]|uniref:Mid2 domain-containing protein n=1 Tax=Mycena indigotica TaxID=2126181 RepID=A0A8H6SXU1_9AGAR|nr:uncharacterized protein MIND_00468900 [Mycena indigotica]KAF7306772.1 hypothetical protein MIND_00468900 [Mycena indigotica]